MIPAIEPQDHRVIEDILRVELPHDAAVWVVGSRATATPRHGADLDLLIDAGRALLLSETVALSAAFDASLLPYRVDIIDAHRIAGLFAENLKRDRVPLSLRR